MTFTDPNPGTPGPQPGQPAQEWAPPQPEPQKKGARKWLAIGGPLVGAVAVGAVTLGGFFGVGDPEVGDCIKTTGETTFDVVDCGSDEAQYKVIGVEEEQQTYAEFEVDPDSCAAFATWEVALWSGPDTGLGTVYCAEPV